MVFGSGREAQEALSACQGDLAASQARVEVLREQVEYLKAQLAQKDGVIQAMVREGYRPDLAPPMPDHEMEDLPAEIMRAIEEIAEPGTGLYHDLMKQAESELQEEDVTTEQVADGILAGGDYNPYA